MLFIITGVTLVFIYYNRKLEPTSQEHTPRISSNKFSQLPRLEEPQEVQQKFGIDKEEHNVAEEYKDDDNEEDDTAGGDSNMAEEENNDVDRDHLDKAAEVPPKDASIQFKGPQNERQRAVVAAFQHAWQGYRTYAWGRDHLKPITKTHQTWFDLGLTLIDSLDTMIVMNLKDEFKEARDWVDHQLHFNINKDVNLFETAIRVLGGLLSTFHLTADKVFLDKAVDLAGTVCK